MIAGARARWVRYEHDRNAASPTYGDKVRVEESGKIVAFERGGMPATWSVLVLSDAGELHTPGVDTIQFAPDETVESRNAAEHALAQIEYLEAYLRENFPNSREDDGERPCGAVADRVPRLLGLLSAEANTHATTLSVLQAEHAETIAELQAEHEERLGRAVNAAAVAGADQAAEIAKLKTERDAIAEQCKRLQATTKATAKKEKKDGNQGPPGTSEKP